MEATFATINARPPSVSGAIQRMDGRAGDACTGSCRLHARCYRENGSLEPMRPAETGYVRARPVSTKQSV